MPYLTTEGSDNKRQHKANKGYTERPRLSRTRYAPLEASHRDTELMQLPLQDPHVFCHSLELSLVRPKGAVLYIAHLRFLLRWFVCVGWWCVFCLGLWGVLCEEPRKSRLLHPCDAISKLHQLLRKAVRLKAYHFAK